MSEVANRKWQKKTNVKSVGPRVWAPEQESVQTLYKTGIDGAEVMSSGSSFQMLAPATGNDRLPE